MESKRTIRNWDRGSRFPIIQNVVAPTPFSSSSSSMQWN